MKEKFFGNIQTKEYKRGDGSIVPARVLRVELDIDVLAAIDILGFKACSSKARKSTALDGAIVARIIKEYS